MSRGAFHYGQGQRTRRIRLCTNLKGVSASRRLHHRPHGQLRSSLCICHIPDPNFKHIRIVEVAMTVGHLGVTIVDSGSIEDVDPIVADVTGLGLGLGLGFLMSRGGPIKVGGLDED